MRIWPLGECSARAYTLEYGVVLELNGVGWNFFSLFRLDKLEEKEKTEVHEMEVVPEEAGVKKETEEPKEEEEEEEFDDEELDDGTDYNTNYFDNGEGYLDEDDDLDEGPCY